MNISLAIMCGVLAFALGFLFGILYGNPPSNGAVKTENPVRIDTLRKLNEEYRNFLSYDGSNQT